MVYAALTKSTAGTSGMSRRRPLEYLSPLPRVRSDATRNTFVTKQLRLSPTSAPAFTTNALRHLTTGGTMGYVLAEARGQRFDLCHNTSFI
ncbi:hypothetical protein EVAR_66184_1 [Eumeta japonica]|uniref:Uncharacterized protein n=1 Tax=Eumeta variegata TaxID=151549 RepID=A0A4C1ZT11_EUMVA|nr:hypothetical protein EVAR_66184_1 [Eumeta japonica]